MSKAAGCLKNTQLWKKKQSTLFYCNILQQQHWSPTHCAHSSAPGQWEAGRRNGKNRWCPWGAKTTGWLSQFCPTTNRFGEGEGEGILVTRLVWPHWLARPLYSDQWGQRSDLVVPESWLSGVSPPQSWISRKRRQTRLPSTCPKSHIVSLQCPFIVKVNISFLGIYNWQFSDLLLYSQIRIFK